MKIKTQISFKEYLKLIFGITYKKPTIRLMVAVGIAMVLWIAGYWLNFLPVPKPLIYQYITLVLIAVAQPIAIYTTIKQNYYSNNHLGEVLEVNITENEINMRGQSFYTEFTVDKIFKIEEETNHILIYQNTLSAVIISKKDMSENEVQQLKTIINRIAYVPVNLKEN